MFSPVVVWLSKLKKGRPARSSARSISPRVEALEARELMTSTGWISGAPPQQMAWRSRLAEQLNPVNPSLTINNLACKDNVTRAISFIAPTTGDYSITTAQSPTHAAMDTVLGVYDAQGNLLAFNNDAPGTLYSALHVWLEAGQTYDVGVGHVEALKTDSLTRYCQLKIHGPERPTVNVSAAGGVFSGNAFVATATVSGLSGVPHSTLEGVGPTLDYQQDNADGTFTDLGNAPPSEAGNYVVTASFAGSRDYTSGSATAAFSIIQATPLVSLSAVGGDFTGNPFVASATVTGVSGVPDSTLEGVGLTMDYKRDNGDGTLTDLGETAPTEVGNYQVTASFAGSKDYTAAGAAAAFGIRPALVANNLGQQLVDWAHDRLGQQVGAGAQCSDLIDQDLKAHGLPSFADLGPTGGDEVDYVWGTLVATFHPGDNLSVLDQIQPGDIIQYRDVVLQGANYGMTAPHHTAMVEANQGGGSFLVLEQNANNQPFVTEGVYNFADMTQGTIWIYRSIGA